MADYKQNKYEKNILAGSPAIGAGIPLTTPQITTYYDDIAIGDIKKILKMAC